MAKKGVKFSKQHLANLRAAHAKRRKKPPSKIVAGILTTKAVSGSLNIGDKITMGAYRVNVDKSSDEWKAVKAVVEQTNGLIDRMTQAIDKIETQIKRLETL